MAFAPRLPNINSPFPWTLISNQACPAVVCSRSCRSEEHTSELQSHSFISYAVFCLKKQNDRLHSRRRRYSDLCLWFFFFNDTATTEIYTLSLHDALPISYLKSGVPGSGLLPFM